LPDSSVDPARAREHPAYFADTGVPALLRAFKRIGIHRPGDLKIWLAGGARIMNATGNFDIGKRNLLACRKALWHNELAAFSEDAGACVTRSVWIEVDTDRPVVEIPGRGRRML
jgi:chemotaxis protein CheD